MIYNVLVLKPLWNYFNKQFNMAWTLGRACGLPALFYFLAYVMVLWYFAHNHLRYVLYFSSCLCFGICEALQETQ